MCVAVRRLLCLKPVLCSFQALTTSAHSVVHHGIPLQAGTAHFGCGDAFQQTLIICPPAIQGILSFKLHFKFRHTLS